MKAHKHAAVIARFAELAQRTEHPETWVEHRQNKAEWRRLPKGEAPQWNRRSEYRITDPNAKVISAPGTPFDGLEGPIQAEPDMGDEFWLLFPDYGSDESDEWVDISSDWEQLKQGRIFRTKDARDAWEAAHIKMTMGGEP